MIRSTPKAFIFFLIQSSLHPLILFNLSLVSLILNLAQAQSNCIFYCKTCGEDGVSCVECHSGYYLSSYSPTGCFPCREGFYLAEGMTSCTPCPEGYNSIEGSSLCQPCTFDQIKYLSSGCETCVPGQFVNTDFFVCADCLEGTYAKTPLFGECDSCPPGHYSGQRAAECSTCPAGSIPQSSQGPCVPCEAGLWSDPGDSVCSCPAGTLSDQGVCVPCGPNLWSNLGDSECWPCPAGTVLDIELGGCVSCRAGLWSASGDVECSSCPAGSIPNAAQSTCVSCGSGLWADSGDSECSSCGQNCDACESSTTCAECKYPTENNNGICVFICQQGQFATSRGCIGNCSVCEGRSNWKGCSANCQECTSKSECTVCKPGYIRQLDTKTLSYTCSPKPKDLAQAATQSAAVGLGATSTVVKSISAGSSSAMGFGVVAKMVRNARYFSIAYSNKTQELFVAEESSSFELNAPASFEYQISSKELHENFAKYDVEPNFLINYWGNMIPILILSSCFVILKILKGYLGQSKGKILTSKVIVMFQVTAGNYLVNNLYGSFDQIVLYFVLEAQTCTFDSAFSWISFLCALVFFIIGIGFFGFHFYILKQYQVAKCGKDADKENNDEKRLENFKLEHAYVKVLFQDFKDDTLGQQSFLASFMIRASLLNLLLCLFVNYPLTQASLYLTFNLAFAIFLVIKRPYEELKKTAAQYFCEIIILITYSCVFILTIMDHNGTDAERSRQILEKIIITLGIALNVGGTVFQLTDILGTVHGVYKSFLAWRARLKIARAPVGAISKALGNHVDLTFMKVKKTGIASLKVSPRSLNKEDYDLVSLNGSPTRLIAKGLDTEMERLDLPSKTSTRKPSTIIFTGESHNDLDYHNRTTIFNIDGPNETRIDHRENVLTPCAIKKMASTIVFTGESQNDFDFEKRTTGVFQIVPSAVRFEERGHHEDILMTESDRIEDGGEVFGDIIVFDYEKIQRKNK